MELAVDGQIALLKVVPAMLGTHALIGIGESIITVAGCLLLVEKTASARTVRGQVTVPLTAAAVIALMLSPFASGFPDGLKWIGRKYHFLHESAPAFVGPLSDYTVPSLSNEMLSTGVAGLLGVIISFGVAWIMLRLMERSRLHPLKL